MTETEQAMNNAVKMYGEVSVAHAANVEAGLPIFTSWENMCFWRDQVWRIAKELAEERKA